MTGLYRFAKFDGDEDAGLAEQWLQENPQVIPISIAYDTHSNSLILLYKREVITN